MDRGVEPPPVPVVAQKPPCFSAKRLLRIVRIVAIKEIGARFGPRTGSAASAASAASFFAGSRTISRERTLSVAIWFPRVSAPPLGTIVRASQISALLAHSATLRRATRVVRSTVKRQVM